MNFPTPRTVQQIRGFIGRLGYCRKFNKDFSKTIKSLIVCLKKDAEIDQTQQFLQCKKIKIYFDVFNIIRVHKTIRDHNICEDQAIGAILSQNRIGCHKLIAIAYERLNKKNVILHY